MLSTQDLSKLYSDIDATLYSNIDPFTDMGFSNSETTLCKQVVDYFHETLLVSPKAQAFLSYHGIRDNDVIKCFKVGFDNRTLGSHLPNGDSFEGDLIRGELQRLGWILPTGSSRYRGSVVFPGTNKSDLYVGAYGRKINCGLRHGTDYEPLHNIEEMGFYNAEALNSGPDCNLFQSPLHLASAICAGMANGIAIAGLNGFTDRQLTALAASPIKRINIAFDTTYAADKAARLISQALMTIDIECFRIRLPRGYETSRYFACNGLSSWLLRCKRGRPLKQSYAELQEDYHHA